MRQDAGGEPGSRQAVGAAGADVPIRARATGPGNDAAVQRLEDRAAVSTAIRTMFSEVRHEALSLLPAGPYPVAVLRSSWDDDLRLIRSGIRIMVVYQADSVRNAAVLSYLTEFAAAGAHVRVARRITHRMIVVDQSCGLLGMVEDSMKPPFLLVREPALVKQLRAQFGGLWRSAHSVGVGPEDALAEDIVRDVLRVMAHGMTDAAAARHLGISERTMRRRAAAVMDLLGAKNRFDAGVKAAEHGWL